MRSLVTAETLPASTPKLAPVMDHPDNSEEQQTRSTLPQQQQLQHGSAQRTSRSQQRQRSSGTYQHPHYSQPSGAAASRRPYQQQEAVTSAMAVSVSSNPAMAAAAMMHHQQQGVGQEVEYHPQHHPSGGAGAGTGGVSGPAGYPMHHQQASSASAPQHYPPPPPQQGYGLPPQQAHYHPHQPIPPGGQPMFRQHHGHPPPQQGHIPMGGQPVYQQQQIPMMEHPQQAQQHQPPQPYIQPTAGRLPADRPLVKLSVSLIETYRQINRVYYEERDARRREREAQRQAGEKQGTGINNHGWDDENYDYIVTNGESFNERYIIKERIGKGSFGQVVRAVDTETNKDVAIKIIKSKKPFLMQAKTEIELLSHLCEKDRDDQNNIVRLVTHFMYRNHQCLVFEMLSLNLYELLKNTQFGGVSLNLIRKFAKQILKALSFLARPDVDIIHCDLKPENILLRHPKRSGVKVIDFGSSCKSNKRMYSYIQSRFYRSPEVMLGLPYSVAIDMWSLGCILVEMHTGEPLFSGSDQFDQMQKIVKVLGMMPTDMLEQSSDQHRLQFFERRGGRWVLKQSSGSSSSSSQQRSSQQTKVVPSEDPIASLAEVIGAETSRKKKYPPTEPGHSSRNYDMFVDLIYRMLAYNPQSRIKPDEALRHPFIVAGEHSHSSGHHSGTRRQSSATDEGMAGHSGSGQRGDQQR